MTAQTAELMNSKYFHPAFNSAIFDGPLRVYFSQVHEDEALKVYFILQNKYAAELDRAKKLHKTLRKTLLVMVYPSPDSYQMAFEKPGTSMVVENLKSDAVLGIAGPVAEIQIEMVLQEILKVFSDWEETLLNSPVNEAHPI